METNFSAAAFPGAPVRSNELHYLIECIRQGECCSLVGPSNTGKSILLKSLLTEEVRQSCARPGAKSPVMVFVDCLEAGNSEQAFYELLLRRTIEELGVAGVSAATLEHLKELHGQVLRSTADVAVRSIYASSVRQLSLEEEMTLVLILDEFYDVFRHLPPWPFRQLRALYDALDTKVCYITGTSHHLDELRSDEDTYEFREMFHLHTLLLRPLSAPDAQQFIMHLAQKQGVELSPKNAKLMVELSGGHPGLLERIYLTLSNHHPDLTLPLQVTIPQLYQERPIQKECQRLWSELESEQEALLTLVEQGGRKLEPAQRQLLEDKGLVLVKENDGMVIFSPVFKVFVEQELAAQSRSVKQGLHCNFDTGQIWMDDREMTLQLSEPQRKLVTFLYRRAGTVCTYDEIAVGVWGVGEGVSPGAIYELVKRVRQKIEPDWKNPQYIVTVPGRGYRLEASV